MVKFVVVTKKNFEHTQIKFQLHKKVSYYKFEILLTLKIFHFQKKKIFFFLFANTLVSEIIIFEHCIHSNNKK